MMKKDPSNPRRHLETVQAQSAKKAGMICGDFVTVERTAEATTAVLADGIGTGVKARVAAVMCASRLTELIRLGFSLREACANMVDTMHRARASDIPFSAFAVSRILNSGHATIISYEIPTPILVDRRFNAYQPRPRSYPLGLEMVSETNCMLDPGDGIIMVSDGVSQAGLGHAYRMGWGIAQVSDFVNGCLLEGIDLRNIPHKILEKVRDISGSTYGDDTTCLLLLCKEGRIVNIFTGPPSRKEKDGQIVRDFMALKGARVVCGSTTAEIVSREIKKPATISNAPDAYFHPPSYRIEGIDLATEGAVTLNQVYNIIDEREDKLERGSVVSELYRLLHSGDTINFLVGGALNPAHGTITFRQMGILPREAIVLLLSEKLQKLGKVVNIQYL